MDGEEVVDGIENLWGVWECYLGLLENVVKDWEIELVLINYKY